MRFVFVYLLILLALTAESQDYRIQTQAANGRQMTTIFPFTPMYFVIEDCDTVSVNILKDSVSRVEGKYMLYAYFQAGKYDDVYNIIVILSGNSSVEIKPSYIDDKDSYYEYELSGQQVDILANNGVIGFLFISAGSVISLVLDEEQTLFYDFLNRN